MGWFTPTVQRALKLCPPVWRGAGGYLDAQQRRFGRPSERGDAWSVEVFGAGQVWTALLCLSGDEARAIMLNFWTDKLDAAGICVVCALFAPALLTSDDFEAQDGEGGVAARGPTRLEATAAAIVALCEKEEPKDKEA